MNDTPTPRTDEFEALRNAMSTRASADYVSALQLCDELERELTAVTEQRDGLRWGIDYASDQLHKVTEQRDRLAEALERILDYQGRFAEEEPESIATEALQSLTPNEL